PAGCSARSASRRMATGWSAPSRSSRRAPPHPPPARRPGGRARGGAGGAGGGQAGGRAPGAFGRGIGALVNAQDPEAVGLSGLAAEVYEAAPDAVQAGYLATLMRFRRPEPPALLPS